MPVLSLQLLALLSTNQVTSYIDPHTVGSDIQNRVKNRQLCKEGGSSWCSNWLSKSLWSLFQHKLVTSCRQKRTRSRGVAGTFVTAIILKVKERGLCSAEMRVAVAFCRKVSGMCFGYQAGSKLWCECEKTCHVGVYNRTASSLVFFMHMRESGG